MGYILTNGFAILLAAAAGLAVGAVFLAARGRGSSPPSELAWPWLATLAFAAEAWLAAILAGALIVAPSTPQAGPWTMALASAAVIWIGFVVPTIAVTNTARGVGWRGTLRDVLHWLLVVLAQAAVLRAVGVSAPA